jgi:SAM-dependent methyltransferase
MEATMTDWFDQDEFWAEFAPVLFGPERWERTPDAANHVLERLGVAAGASILDLCCGPGRYALEFARRGFCVTGVDRTIAYLDEARRRADVEGLKVELVREDMRSFVRPGGFDAAVNLFTSFGYFEDPADDLRVARHLHESLRPGGKLLMELIGREVIAAQFQERDWYWVDRERGLRMLEERNLRPGWDWIESTWTLLGGPETVTRTISHRLYTGSELAALLRRAGFASVELFGSLDGTPYDQRAKRLVVVGAKGA